MKKIREVLLSSAYTLKERLFLLGAIVSTLTMIGAFILAVIYGDSLVSGIAPLIGGLITGLTGYYSFKYKHIDLGAAIITLVGVGIILPYGFLVGGGVYSGSPTWFVIGIVVVFMFFKGKEFIIFYIIATVSFAAAIYISYLKPELVISLNSTEAIYIDAFLAALAVGTLIGILLQYHNQILEKEIKISEDQHNEIEQLNAAQNRFFSSMSHEIRTPINTIIGLNEMTLREKNLSEEAIENSLNIQNASKMLLSLINDILDLSKIQSGQMELTEYQYETSKMLSEIVNLLWNRAKDKGLQFVINVGNNIPSMLYGDEIRIKQIIINLLTNAIKYTNEGTVTLIVDGEKSQANTFLLKITVEDTGQGIRKENLPIIFDSFKRFEGKENKMIEGTGLGLSITKQLVELMNGQISVDSIFTKGSNFHVAIPQRIVSSTPINFKGIAEVNRELEQYQQSFEAPDARVLVVDDNDMNRIVCRKLLRETKVKVDLAASGKECLDKTIQTKYHAIFMDHEMPDMDGIETLKRLRSQPNGLCHDTPVIALTANAGSDRNNFYLEQGFQAYLAKPIHGSLLEATLLRTLPPEIIEKSWLTKEEDIIQVMQNRRKKAISISCDCVADLPQDILYKYDIKVMPFYILTNEGRFKDTSEIDAINLYQYLDDQTKDIKTEPSSVEEYEAFFGKLLSEADTVVHFATSSSISESYNFAIKAAESFDNVKIIDSKSLSLGIGMQVIKACELVEQGYSVGQIISEIELYRKNIVMNFLIPSIELVNKSRKQSLLSRFFVNVLNFEPEFSINNKGLMRINKFFMGYLNDPITQYIASNFRNKQNINTSKLYLMYSGYNEEQRQVVVNEIKKYINFDEIVIQKASATNSANCGLNALGLGYERINQKDNN